MRLYPHVKFITGGILKPSNPDILVDFGDHRVKFHHQSLEYVIEHS